jgi:hypothetical protein
MTGAETGMSPIRVARSGSLPKGREGAPRGARGTDRRPKGAT